MQNAPKYTNDLINETSPYLLQHAHNPVNWFAWNEAAFEKARAEDKPVLLSIGYSACHWCHVMERESFENEEIAGLMNENFVSVKVDLEERPDVDQIYMTFVQMTTGGGGYPLNVFLTPDKKPFFGGTYFPPERKFNMPSFPQVLTSIADAWREKRGELIDSADDIVREIKKIGMAEFAPETLSGEILDAAFAAFVRSFDNVNGGFGGAPKFPPAMALEFLLRYYHQTEDANALAMVEKTARKMANGGIYDQLGGGFHRYTVDAIWLTPHFEKMLYDNAQLARVYLHLFQITKNEFYRRVAAETLDYVKREMTGAGGGFYSAQDADSEGVEGKFFVWTPAEIIGILGEEDARIFNFFYDVSDAGNFEGENIPHADYTIDEAANALKIGAEDLQTSLDASRAKLFAAREKRVKPFRDEKVLTAWNGLMLAAFAEAAAIFNSAEYLEIAENNADFLLENLQSDNCLLRCWKDGAAKLNAYLEDYANFTDGLLELFQVSGEPKYLRAAKQFADLIIAEFWDEANGGFYFTAENHEELLLRTKDFYDNAVPSGNSVAADALLKLAKLTGIEKYENYAVNVMRLVAPQIRRYPNAFGRILAAAAFYLNPTKEIVIIGKPENELTREIWNEYLPFKIVVTTAAADADLIPLLENRRMIENKATAYVCEKFICQKPVTTVEDLRRDLRS